VKQPVLGQKKATVAGGSFQEELLWLAATMSIITYIGHKPTELEGHEKFQNR